MCTFDEQKLNKTERKGHVHIMCRCVNYNTINNSCVYRADNSKHNFFFSFLKSFMKDSDNLHRKIVTFIKTYTNSQQSLYWQQFQVLNRHLKTCVTDHDVLFPVC